jgi:predicted regulator of Ras-like GTPase activity (Roadblock/LC7/MglB family)
MNTLSKLARTQLTRLPEVVASVVTDRTGTLLDSSGDVDGETVGAVHAVCAESLDRTGETLGLGSLQRASVTGPKRVCVIAECGDEIVGMYVDPTKSLATFERKLDSVLRQ